MNKNINWLIILKITVITLIAPFVYSHGADSTKPAHQYLTNESKFVWTLIPYETKSHMNNNLYNQLDGLGLASYDQGDDVITGSAEEDRTWTTFNSLWTLHYWNPDNPKGGKYDDGLGDSRGNFLHTKIIWENDVIKNYLKGNINESYYHLGRVAHLMQDASVPAHMHNDCHISVYPFQILCGDDSYESFIADVNGSFPDTQNKPNFYHFKGADYQNQYYKYENLSYLTDAQWLEVNKRLDEISYPSNLFKLFWYTAQKTQYFASDDKDGNDYYRKWYDIWSAQDFSPPLWQGENVIIINDSALIEESQQTCGVNNCSNLKNISQALMPHAMKATAGLYRLFYEVGA